MQQPSNQQPNPRFPLELTRPGGAYVAWGCTRAGGGLNGRPAATLAYRADAWPHTPARRAAPAGTVKTIPLDAVRLASVIAKARKPGMVRTGRVAAYTDCPLVGRSCDGALRGHAAYQLPPCHFLPMTSAGLGDVLERTRLHRGLQEVRRTWGTGYRALQAEFAKAVMQ